MVEVSLTLGGGGREGGCGREGFGLLPLGFGTGGCGGPEDMSTQPLHLHNVNLLVNFDL